MTFRNFLEDIYGRNIVNNLLDVNYDKFKSQLEIKSAIESYGNKYGLINRETNCNKCTNPSHQEFPGWIGSLEYDNESKISNKDIIILGLEISDKGSVKKVLNDVYLVDWSNIHIWYDFGYYQSAKDLINSKSNSLFKNLNLFLNLENRENLNRLYGTDIAKCFTDKKDQYNTRKICSEKFLLKELQHFRNEDLIFVLQGKNAKNFMKRYFRFIPDIEQIKCFDFNDKKFENYGIKADMLGDYNIEFGLFYGRNLAMQEKEGRYLMIPHSGGQTKGLWNKLVRNEENFKDILHKIKKFLKINIS